MNYSPQIQMLMEQIEEHCPKIEEVGLRNSWVQTSFVENGNIISSSNSTDSISSNSSNSSSSIDDGSGSISSDSFSYEEGEEAEMEEGKGVEGYIVVNLIRKEGQICTLCERPRTKGWHREPQSPKIAKSFSWKRFMYSVALRDAAFKGLTREASLLIKTNTCNVNGQTQEGWTALLGAAWNGYIEIVKILVEADRSSINIQTVDDRRTALMWACEYGHSPVIEFLIRSGADIHLVDKEGKTAMEYLDYSALSPEEKTRLKGLALEAVKAREGRGKLLAAS